MELLCIQIHMINMNQCKVLAVQAHYIHIKLEAKCNMGVIMCIAWGATCRELLKAICTMYPDETIPLRNCEWSVNNARNTHCAKNKIRKKIEGAGEQTISCMHSIIFFFFFKMRICIKCQNWELQKSLHQNGLKSDNNRSMKSVDKKKDERKLKK